ncbi:MAG: 3-hydroxypropanoate dehydrogenase [Marinomonas primoryensis]|jgi:3-hydroxypropanoate dehydrogenase
MDKEALNNAGLDLIFRSARTYNAWQDRGIPRSVMEEVYELAKMGPTSANCCPARFVFVSSTEAKAKLQPCLAEGNVAKTMQAPCCVIVAYDREFYEQLPELFPSRDMRAMFAGNAALIEDTARRNVALQGGYLIMAARAIGLDCGPMSGFDREAVDKAFFPDGQWRSDFLCSLGYGDAEGLYPRSPRLDFSTACQVL